LVAAKTGPAVAAVRDAAAWGPLVADVEADTGDGPAMMIEHKMIALE